MSNQELWARAKQRPIELEIQQRKWGWLGHTLCRRPGDIAKAALEWNPQGTRPRTWRRTILEEIRHQGKTWKEVKVLAKNRVRWWNFGKALCSLEEWWETIYIYIHTWFHFNVTSTSVPRSFPVIFSKKIFYPSLISAPHSQRRLAPLPCLAHKTTKYIIFIWICDNPPSQSSIFRKIPKYNFSDDELGNDSCLIVA